MNRAPGTAEPHPPGCAIYVLIDALGWELVRDRPFLDDLLVERRWLQTILGYSSGAIPSILSGRYPNEHGHWNLFYLSPETSPFRWVRHLRYLPPALVENRGARRAIRAISRRLSGYRGYFATYNFSVARLPFFDLCERRDIYQPGGLETCPSLFDVFIQAGIPYECFTYHRYNDAEILALVPERLRTSSARVYFLYLSELDAYLHFHIGDAGGVAERLRWYEAGLRRIYRAARDRWGEARLYIFSDHGMTPVRWTHDLAGGVRRLGLSVPEDLLPVYDSTMARFWTWTDRAQRILADFLADQPCGRLLKDSELQQLGIWFPDGRYGHLVFLLHPGGIICPSDMGRIRFGGMHGYHPSEPTADAALLASVPVPKTIDHITGVHRLILDDLGISMNRKGP